MTNKTHHIDEQTLTRIILKDVTLGFNERNDIERHLEQCEGCRDLFIQIQEFYAFTSDEIEKNEMLGKRHKNSILKSTSTPTVWTEPITKIIPSESKSFPVLLWFFAKKRPLISSASSFLLMAAVVVIINNVNGIFKDHNPSYLTIELRDLNIFNNNGEILWRKPINIDGVNSEELNTTNTKSIKLIKIDKEGNKQILTLFSFLNDPTVSKNSVTLYDNKGKIVWSQQLGSEVASGGNKYSLDFRKHKMVVYNHNNILRILVLILHTHSPAAIIALDVKGKIIGECWNYGHFNDLELIDVDGDGKQELVTTVINDELNQSTICAIDPEKIIGKKQLSFSSLDNIEYSKALKYYTSVDHKIPFSVVRNSFGSIGSIGGNKIKVEYGPLPDWLYTFTFGKNLQLDEILSTDTANEKYGIKKAKEERISLIKSVKHWEYQALK